MQDETQTIDALQEAFADGWDFYKNRIITDIKHLQSLDMSDMGTDYEAGYRQALSDIISDLSANLPDSIDTSDANFQQGYADEQHTRAVSYNALTQEQQDQICDYKEFYKFTIDWSTYDDDSDIYLISNSGQFVGFTFEQ